MAFGVINQSAHTVPHNTDPHCEVGTGVRGATSITGNGLEFELLRGLGPKAGTKSQQEKELK
jgi:hypothetical protein